MKEQDVARSVAVIEQYEEFKFLFQLARLLARAAPWLEQHPQGQVNSVEYDFDLHKEVLARMGLRAEP